jgi:hypothetical protein
MNTRTLYLPLFAIALAAALFLADGIGTRRQAEAAPATSLNVHSQFCLPNGTVAVNFQWVPHGGVFQFLDVTSLNNNFAFGFANAGPLWQWESWWTFGGLQQNTTYFARVNTWNGTFWESSNVVAFQTGSCAGQFTPPSNLNAVNIGNATRVSWTPGINNFWFCVDTAESNAHLLNFGSTWRNWGCGTTATVLDISGLPCGTTIHWRVWAVGPGTSGHSSVSTFTSPACAFQPPTNVDHDVLSGTSVKWDWDASDPAAFWYCVDYAESTSDLVNFGSTWRNACTTDTEVTVMTLTCNTQYRYRVFAFAGSAQGYSAQGTVTTAPC